NPGVGELGAATHHPDARDDEHAVRRRARAAPRRGAHDALGPLLVGPHLPRVSHGGAGGWRWLGPGRDHETAQARASLDPRVAVQAATRPASCDRHREAVEKRDVTVEGLLEALGT